MRNIINLRKNHFKRPTLRVLTTGYCWALTISPPKGVISIVSNEYIPDENKTRIPMLGMGGKRLYTFESVAKGEAELVFQYLRQTSNDRTPAETVTYKAIVDDKNTLTLIKQ
jgi:predicted secreted protein